MGVNIGEMKIVGLLSDEDEMDEMANIAKVFVVGERMKHLKYDKKIKEDLKKKESAPSKKIHLLPEESYKHLPVFTVRGLN